MLYLYNFEVTYWDDGCQSIAKGIAAGRTYSEALDAVVGYYDDEHIEEIKLGIVDDTEGGLLITDIIIPNPIKQSKQLQEEK
jgi:hypothetical protein